ncbi:MAG: DUF1492 domain-containing protein [Clostridiales bacterium]|nr:DUF1492 domain-containing protein [Clostridiales bacterium]
MTAKEYLRQAYRLDQKINSDIAEAARLREIASSVSAPSLGERVQTPQSNEAPFVRRLEKVMLLEESINKEIDLYVDLKKQIRTVIDTVPDTDERLVLKFRYIHNYTWEQIGNELRADSRTVRRWHGNALTHVVMPENPIQI